MKNFAKALLIAAIFLGACSPNLDSGNQKLNSEQPRFTLLPSVTTKADVRKAFGLPSSISRPGEMSISFLSPQSGSHREYPMAEIWTYASSQLSGTYPLDPRPVSSRYLVLRVFFDETGRVIDHEKRETRN